MRRREVDELKEGAGERPLLRWRAPGQFRAFAGGAPALPVRTRQPGRRRGSARRYNGLLPGAG